MGFSSAWEYLVPWVMIVFQEDGERPHPSNVAVYVGPAEARGSVQHKI